MKQDITRDYITDCFRYYACVKAGRAKPETDAELADIAAAGDTLSGAGALWQAIYCRRNPCGVYG